MISVGIGAFFGAIARFALSNFINKHTRTHFPIATFLVNCIGCCLMGFVIHSISNNDLYLLLVVGFLGAFTTFSTFSLETIQLIEKKKVKLALLYVFSTVIVGLTLTYGTLLVLG